MPPQYLIGVAPHALWIDDKASIAALLTEAHAGETDQARSIQQIGRAARRIA